MPDPAGMTRIGANMDGVVSRMTKGALCAKPPLNEQEFRRLMASATPIPANDPTLSAWHYAPWCSVEFTTVAGNNEAQLFLGGRGVLTQPNGDRGMFRYQYPKAAKP
jgi:hypothetical protein